MNTLKFIPLGGIGDVQKNMFVYEYGNDQIVVDCGIGFPNNQALGVDVVIPDISYLEKPGKKLHGIILTHGHQDHFGGLPYILPRLSGVPVYGSTLSIALAETKVREYGLTNKMVAVENHLKLGPFDIEFLHITHSVPNCKHLYIKTPGGTVYHGADYKFDLTPIDNRPADFTGIARVGAMGVDLMLTDSLGVGIAGFTPSERTLLNAIDATVRTTTGKLIFTTISSSISRIDMAVQACVRYNRKVALAGRSIVQNIEAATKCGYIKIPNGTLIDIKQVNRYKPNQVAVIIAGSQGQEGSAMQRLAAGEHQFLKLKANDHVVISVDAIPGTEGSVNGLIDTLYKQDVRVSYSGSTPGLHVSGHGHRGDLALLARLVKPKNIIPMGGNIRHMYVYKELAMEMGYTPEQVIIPENGQVIGIENHKIKVVGRVETKNVYVDGLGIGDVGNVVLRDRKVLAADGILLTVVPIKSETAEVAGEVEIVSRGFVYQKEAGDLIKQTEKQVVNCLKDMKGRQVTDWGFVRRKIEDTLERFLYQETQRRPMIIAVVIEV
ncbi:ribonuclease J [Candidatus Collierbacteria bacterium]|nr:ribonuclease J [Candidatus Collierbacteria bacterium]